MGHSSLRCNRTWGLALVVLCAFGGGAAVRAQTIDGASLDGVEILTRGPVHEAFAVPVVNDAAPGLIVPKSPPAAIEEMPPDQKPVGAGVQWIPGYWSWDQAREDFVWISGIWREPPPGRHWIPGYWNPVANGMQWVPGAWAPVAVAAQGGPVYLPEPPVSLEAGPNIPQPSGDVFWSPGCWTWSRDRYVWRPGFWAAVQPAWVWVPAHYVWTPAGCLFVDGYWDLPLAERGVLFAPVYYARPVYLRPAYVYTPTITVATAGLVANLFVQPTYHHYCFGDYYDRRFLTAGVFPWFSIGVASGPRPPAYYDPLFTFYSCANRGNPGWAARGRDAYVQRRDNIAMRPPRTYVEQTRLVQNNVNITRQITIINKAEGGRPGEAMMIGRPMGPGRREPGAVRTERIEPAARERWQARSRELAEFRTGRVQREIEAPRPGAGPQMQTRPRPMASPISPVVAARSDRGGGPGRPERTPILVGGGRAREETRSSSARPSPAGVEGLRRSAAISAGSRSNLDRPRPQRPTDSGPSRPTAGAGGLRRSATAPRSEGPAVRRAVDQPMRRGPDARRNP